MKPTRSRIHLLLLFALLAGMQACSSAEQDTQPVARGGGGVFLIKDAVVFTGSPFNCTRPATIDFEKVRAATPEWQAMQAESVRSGSARHRLLSAQMHDRIVAAARNVARGQGRDLIVRLGDIRDANGLEIADLTAQVGEKAAQAN